MASSALLPPFKTVRVEKEGPSLKKAGSTVHIQQQTILYDDADKDHLASRHAQGNADCSGSSEIIPPNDQVALRLSTFKQEEIPLEVRLGNEGKAQLDVQVGDAPSEGLAAPFSPDRSEKFLGFEISKVGLRNTTANIGRVKDERSPK